jgi:AraC-like DNA-binding protein
MLAIGIAIRKVKSKQALSPETEQPLEPVSVNDDPLMQRIYQLMDRERPYLRSELKVSDVAEKLGVSSRVLSDCIRNSTGNTFANFINAYRIDHAKQLMRTQPDIKISEVFLSSGFANETTFFRVFKAATGMTPTEWKRID